jgi:hypothetical protein
MSATTDDDQAGYFRSYACPGSDFVVVVEDDERVAYAYVLDEDEIVGDVWLYNRHPAPAEIDRSASSGMAPLNHASCVAADRQLSPPLGPHEDCEVVWTMTEQGGVETAAIVIRGRLYARLAPGAKPGWCIAAAEDGPLARVLHP